MSEPKKDTRTLLSLCSASYERQQAEKQHRLQLELDAAKAVHADVAVQAARLAAREDVSYRYHEWRVDVATRLDRLDVIITLDDVRDPRTDTRYEFKSILENEARNATSLMLTAMVEHYRWVHFCTLRVTVATTAAPEETG